MKNSGIINTKLYKNENFRYEIFCGKNELQTNIPDKKNKINLIDEIKIFPKIISIFLLDIFFKNKATMPIHE
ncbi:MAG: hypothetical protein FWC41_02685 [Firmicutes bacterium]|nr:hypothetical protein [Bacillota bacterium]